MNSGRTFMDSTDEAIWNLFGIQQGDMPPFWSERPEGRMLLPKLFHELGFKRGAEIGVQTGKFSQAICVANPTVEMVCVDPYKPYSFCGMSHRATCERWMHRAQRRLRPYKAEFMRMTSHDAALVVPNASLDFVYIDGAHDFDNVMMDLILWSPKVRKGGIVSGHDYMENYRQGVVQAVNTYVHAHGVQPWYITWSTYGRGRTTVDPPSFFWVQRENA
jgi:hypothetical protein